MKVISLINQKGGTGKTTSAVNIAGRLKMLGKKVLLIDLDYQRNLTVSITEKNFEKTIFNLMADRMAVNEVIYNTNGFDIIPGDIKMRKTRKRDRGEGFQGTHTFKITGKN